MNYLLMTGVILASGLSVASLSSEEVFAATNSVNTTGDVTFKEDTTPVDSTNPVKPTNGPLSIDYASSFNFGEQKIYAKDETYYASFDPAKETEEGEAVNKTNWVQGTDKRGTNAGWKLQVQQGAQFSTTQNGTSKELKGAQIKIKNGTVATTTDNKATAPTASIEVTLIPGVSEKVKDVKYTTQLTWLLNDTPA